MASTGKQVPEKIWKWIETIFSWASQNYINGHTRLRNKMRFLQILNVEALKLITSYCECIWSQDTYLRLNEVIWMGFNLMQLVKRGTYMREIARWSSVRQGESSQEKQSRLHSGSCSYTFPTGKKINFGFLSHLIFNILLWMSWQTEVDFGTKKWEAAVTNP